MRMMVRLALRAGKQIGRERTKVELWNGFAQATSSRCPHFRVGYRKVRPFKLRNANGGAIWGFGGDPARRSGSRQTLMVGGRRSLFRALKGV